MKGSAKQSIAPHKERMDCFVANAPRNDVDRQESAFSRRDLRWLATVIASQRVGAKRRPMTGSAKQSIAPHKERMDCFVASAPRNDVDGQESAFSRRDLRWLATVIASASEAIHRATQRKIGLLRRKCSSQ
jgi:hypothetical protein